MNKRTPEGRLSVLTVQARDCYDPTEYILIHQDRLSGLLNENKRLKEQVDFLRKRFAQHMGDKP